MEYTCVHCGTIARYSTQQRQWEFIPVEPPARFIRKGSWFRGHKVVATTKRVSFVRRCLVMHLFLIPLCDIVPPPQRKLQWPV
jgi:hypothetical protein